MIDIVQQGIIIGLCTSAPVGPIALLCIQRTLQKGRLHGFFSGLGAALSDFCYAMIAILGLSFVTDFIAQHDFVLQIAGSIVIMGFGVYIFFQNPTKSLKKSEEGKTTYSQECVTAFLLTLSNPLMIFLFLGLFARFSFLSNVDDLATRAIGMASVFLGSVSWWFCLTFVASLFHRKFNIRGLKVLNRIMGLLIAGIALAGLILSLSGSSLSAI